MTVATVDFVPTELARGRGGGGPAPTRIVVAYGFWIFLLSDFVLFSGLFAAHAVLSGNTAGGPTGSELFDLRKVFIETTVRKQRAGFCCSHSKPIRHGY